MWDCCSASIRPFVQHHVGSGNQSFRSFRPLLQYHSARKKKKKQREKKKGHAAWWVSARVDKAVFWQKQVRTSLETKTGPHYVGAIVKSAIARTTKFETLSYEFTIAFEHHRQNAPFPTAHPPSTIDISNRRICKNGCLPLARALAVVFMLCQGYAFNPMYVARHGATGVDQTTQSKRAANPAVASLWPVPAQRQ